MRYFVFILIILVLSCGALPRLKYINADQILKDIERRGVNSKYFDLGKYLSDLKAFIYLDDSIISAVRKYNPYMAETWLSLSIEKAEDNSLMDDYIIDLQLENITDLFSDQNLSSFKQKLTGSVIIPDVEYTLDRKVFLKDDKNLVFSLYGQNIHFYFKASIRGDSLCVNSMFGTYEE